MTSATCCVGQFCIITRSAGVICSVKPPGCAKCHNMLNNNSKTRCRPVVNCARSIEPVAPTYSSIMRARIITNLLKLILLHVLNPISRNTCNTFEIEICLMLIRHIKIIGHKWDVLAVFVAMRVVRGD